jgi:predicted ATPase
MIDRLSLVNFKAFDSVVIPLGGYTLLSGLNSSGKSTVLQAIALMRQAVESFDGDPRELEGVPLNGDLVELGTGQDILYEDYTIRGGTGPEIEFLLAGKNCGAFGFALSYGANDDYLRVARVHQEVSPEFSEEGIPLFSPGFQYLRADRISPAVTYPRSERMSVRRRSLGTHGEYAVDFLRANLDDVVNAGPLRRDDASPRLLDQVQAWMGEICPGVRIEAAVIEHTDLVRLGFQFATSRRPVSRTRRPTNVGFGLTYALPIVVACLAAEPGSLILLENPEAHVHPRGQSVMARLTCAAAANGAQLVVETHSDHILNGVRLAVKRGVLPASEVALHYFERADDGIRIVTPELGSDGMLSKWPDGFFDEWGRSLDELLDLPSLFP